MRQTLFYLPHFLFEGWLLLAWILLGAILIGWQAKRKGWSKETFDFLPVLVIGGLIIYFVLPHLETSSIDPMDPKLERRVVDGLPIRGYGLMLLLGTLAGVGLASLRARQTGMDPESIFSLSFWMFLFGIAGARLFYVFQYRDEFEADNLTASLVGLIDMTKGGLVVYGSLIGASIAGLVYLRIKRLPLLPTADVIAPAMAIGLAIGRIGCFFNGCCFGGQCDWPTAVSFPAGSPPYMRQLETGTLLGLQTSAGDQEGKTREVQSVTPDSLAQRQGIEAGDRFPVVRPPAPERIVLAQQFDAADLESVWKMESGRQLQFRLSDLPRQSLAVHPTQIYSAINAALICGFLWFYFPYRFGPGEVFAWMLIVYPISRFLLEAVRTDEVGQFGTVLTISQWVSIGAIAVGIGLLAWIRLAAPPAPSNPRPGR